VKEPQRDNNTGLQVVIKELVERLGNMEAWHNILMVLKQGLGIGTTSCWTKAAVSFMQ
jgi:hypothetical protein